MAFLLWLFFKIFASLRLATVLFDSPKHPRLPKIARDEIPQFTTDLTRASSTCTKTGYNASRTCEYETDKDLGQSKASGSMWKQAIASPVGSLQASWTEDGLRALSFLGIDYPNSAAHATEFEPTETPRRIRVLTRKLVDALDSYFDGAELNWSLDDLDWAGVSEFHRQVLELCHAIPAGQTLTYGQLAKLAGSPQAYRAVGGAMARNRWPLVIPCHRVVGSSGKLTGYSGEGGTKTKHWLLEHEFHASRGNLFLAGAR